MCGRFTITLDGLNLQADLGLGDFDEVWQPRYNVAPSQGVPVVVDAELRNVSMMRWGLVPAWAKDETIGYRLINARSETLIEKPSFRSSFKSRRCLILADGFYEWKPAVPGKKGNSQPYYFFLKDKKPFSFAGLWDKWTDKISGRELLTCTIITTGANGLVSPVHGRMPVILDKEHMWDWLAPESLIFLQSLLRPYDEGNMACYPVSKRINDPKVDIVECIERQPGLFMG